MPKLKLQHNPYNIVTMFEEALADYTGAKFAVTTSSCTSALFIVFEFLKIQNKEIIVPRKTYLSPIQSLIRAGGIPVFKEIEWKGIYQFEPLPVYDAAKRLHKNMYISNTFMCLSFHIKKHLKIGKGGCILTDNLEFVEFAKKYRYEGRTAGFSYHFDDVELLGTNDYMRPQDAAIGLCLLEVLPNYNEDLGEEPDYRNLDEFKLFSSYKVLDAYNNIIKNEIK